MSPGNNINGHIGRFAPSPTGPLHIGSLVSALASFLQARQCGGRWLVRMEDIDPPREQAGAATSILASLRAHGLLWDGELLWQHSRLPFYQQTVNALLQGRQAFFCCCSRTDLAPTQGIHHHPCRTLCRPDEPAAVRLQVDALDIVFVDALQGEQRQAMAQEVGDFVVQRRDGLFAYQLAVVVDDAYQGITDIVRGCDLLDSSARQIYLQRCLQLPQPRYAHVPVITGDDGQKLSKQNLAPPLRDDCAIDNLLDALHYLRQPPPPVRPRTVDEVLTWALEHWSLQQVAGITTIPLSAKR